ncbi:MAG: hypothetical protein ACLFMQ_01725 [Desulfohalobiaceae bacterium]
MIPILGVVKGFLGKFKALVAVSLILLSILGVLAWQYKGELQESARLAEIKEKLLLVNQINQEAISQLQDERKSLEQALKDRAKREQELQQELREKDQELQTKLQDLRDEHEDVQEFLDLPVPQRFVDGWMRRDTQGSDQDQGGED